MLEKILCSKCCRIEVSSSDVICHYCEKNIPHARAQIKEAIDEAEKRVATEDDGVCIQCPSCGVPLKDQSMVGSLCWYCERNGVQVERPIDMIRAANEDEHLDSFDKLHQVGGVNSQCAVRLPYTSSTVVQCRFSAGHDGEHTPIDIPDPYAKSFNEGYDAGERVHNRISDIEKQEIESRNLQRGAVRYDGGKPRFDLIPSAPLTELAKVYAFGATKYADRNWEKGMRFGRIFAAMMRHAWKFWQGERIDEESGLHHMAQVAWGALALLEYDVRGTGEDDRPKTN